MTDISHPLFVGCSEPARQIDEDIRAAAASDAKVLITGETGAGKDIVARSIHQRSARRLAGFSAINCAGIQDTLLESELFGHVRGSFTGAVRDKAGLLEAVDRGTAFLDEAGEMSLRMQGVLLRFLETGEVQRVGSERLPRRVNVRIVAATNRDLAVQMEAGAFRQDLYYRLNVIRIHVPPLRERLDDLPALFAHFSELLSRQYGAAPRTLTREAEAKLRNYRWPGNVRELKNVVERLVVSAPGRIVEAHEIVLEGEATKWAAESSVEDGGHGGWHRETAPTGLRLVRREEMTDRIVASLLEDGASFWDVVHAPFMGRDLSREQLRTIVRAGLERTSGNYRMLAQLFNMPAKDYKRFLNFLRKHDCQVPFHTFRGLAQQTERMRTRSEPAYLEAAGM